MQIQRQLVLRRGLPHFSNIFQEKHVHSNIAGLSTGRCKGYIQYRWLANATVSKSRENKSALTTNLVNSLYHNVSWFNHHYERVFGIAEVRNIQNRVIEAEEEFVAVTQDRKSCQDKIEALKEEIKSIRDKLDITPRQSDNYLNLITQEHKFLREQLALDVQLSRLKECEQMSLDQLSKLLRQSHELERLRQERAKYLQMISIALSVVGSLIALIAQRIRSQKSIMTQMTALDARLSDVDKTIQLTNENNEIAVKMMLVRLDELHSRLDQILATKDQQTAIGPHKHQTGWSAWIPGLGYLRSMSGYLF